MHDDDLYGVQGIEDEVIVWISQKNQKKGDTEKSKKKQYVLPISIPFEISTQLLHLLSLVLHRDHHHAYSYVGTFYTIELGLYIPMMSLLKRALGLLEQAS